ncbi:MAG: ROK family transcriptional regulator [Rhodobacteraceae bacterium]|nr:ROK family transcriptional regulator [Paracoccaceae bacterium]
MMGKNNSQTAARPVDGAAGRAEFADKAGRITRHSGIGPEQAGTLNRWLVLDMIRRSGGLSRADLTRATGLTPQATSVIVARLVKSGHLSEIARRKGGLGAPSRIFAINPSGAYSFGASIESDLLTVVLIDLAGHIVARNVIRLNEHGPKEAFAAIRQITEALASATGIDRRALVGLGLGIPGRYDPGRAALIPPSFDPVWNDVPVAEDQQDLLGIPVFWENDANAGAIGECFRGAGVRFQSLLFLHIGRGIGSGLILNGEPYRGCESNAGEIGRIRVHLPHLSPAPLRLSQVATVNALEERLRRADKTLSETHDITRLMSLGDQDVIGWLADTADAVAQALCSVIYVLDLEAVVVGGMLEDVVIDRIVEAVVPKLEQNLFHWNRTPSVIRGTAGPDAGALGAATIPLFSVFAARA